MKTEKTEEKRIQDAMQFYLLATQLKYKIRSGWDKTHWNIKGDRKESIAEHVYGTCILALSIASEFDYAIDLNKVLKMLVIHELEEVVIGDITPFEHISEEEKMRQGHLAIQEVIGDLIHKEELINLIIEFDAKETPEAQFAFHCDKLEADIQAKVYQDKGLQHDLDDQKNNVVFQNKKAQQIIQNGAQTAFDVWYEWDKSKFEDDHHFSNVLQYVKNNPLNVNQKQPVKE